MSLLRDWWDQPDQFESITAFLSQRGLLPAAQRTMAVVAGSSGCVPVSVLVSQRHLTSLAVAVGALATVFIFGTAACWLIRWPTARQSGVCATAGVLTISLWGPAQPTATVAILACTATAVTGGYIAFFHNTKLLAFNALLAVMMTIPAAIRLAREAGIAAAIVAFWLIVFLNVSVPLSIRGMSRAMCAYAEKSDADPLTGLLNRRGFMDAIARRLARPSPTETHLAVMMVDLDNFKRINDTHGHSAGDDVLSAVADLLRECFPPHAAISRAGGEEFLIALTSAAPGAAAPLARRLCTGIAALPHQLTASVGTAICELHCLRVPEPMHAVQQLIAMADMAMYMAKDRGGNQVQHA